MDASRGGPLATAGAALACSSCGWLEANACAFKCRYLHMRGSCTLCIVCIGRMHACVMLQTFQ